jgi:hypothetical protein
MAVFMVNMVLSLLGSVLAVFGVIALVSGGVVGGCACGQYGVVSAGGWCG